jgi:proteasome lid subunit RPN8/RPN11
MNILPASIVAIQGDLLAHAFEKAPEEACGLIVSGKYIPCKNAHSSPLTNFAIDAKDYARASKRGDIQAVFHSHPDKMNKFSLHDIRACKQSNLPWVMYCVGTGDWSYADPSGDQPYLGRQWHYGVSDCYALFRDFYRREFGIILDDFERGEDLEWASPGWSMFQDNVLQQGFVDIEEPSQKGDMLLMQLQASSPNHAGFLAEPDKNIFYHHLVDRLSQADIYGGYWTKNTVRVLRHKTLLSC